MISYGSMKSMLGKSAVFIYELTGDRWHITGGTDVMKFDEFWQRVK
jgi:hypothetical protein